MRKLADHIRQAHEDAEKVRISSDKITRRFNEIERVELDVPEHLKRVDVNMVTPASGEPERARSDLDRPDSATPDSSQPVRIGSSQD